MTDPWVCIIGGGASQVPFIEAAAGRGLNTIVFDIDPDAPAAGIATEFVAVSTHDTTAVLEHLEALPHHLQGCFTYSSFEAALRTTVAVVDQFGVRGLSGESLDRTASKTAMHRHLADAGVAVPEVLLTADVGELDTFCGRHGRVIVKPAQGSVGSAGVGLVDGSVSDSSVLLAEACELSSDGLAVVEPFLDGIEYSVDGFVIDGDAHILAISRKQVLGPEQHFVIAGYTTGGGAVDTETISVLSALVKRSVGALAIDNSYFSLDIVDTGAAQFVIDAGPLLDAKIDRLLHHGGVDVYGIAADTMLGLVTLELDLRPGTHALRFIYADRSGVLDTAKPGRFNAGGVEIVLEMEQPIGAPVRPPQSVSDVVGWTIASGANSTDLWATLVELDLSERIVIS